MFFLWLTCVMLLPICAVSGVWDQKVRDEQCFNNCSCCIEGKCGRGVYGWTHECTIGCIDGHRGARCYELCQYENCKTCGGVSQSNECTECYDGYYLGSNKDCTLQCPSNCKSCTTSTVCTECKEGFYDKDGSTTCKYAYCPANCECNRQGDCVSCKKGYYGTSTSCIKQCPVNCLTCVSDESCNECKKGFYNGYEYDNNINFRLDNCTYACRHTCTQCRSYNNCLQCVNGKYRNTCQEDCSAGCKDRTCSHESGHCECTVDFTGDKCLKCVHGKYGTNCELECPVNCTGKECNRSSGTCFGCDGNFQGEMCEECTSGYYGANCNLSCSPHCSSSSCNSNNGTCVNGCMSGYSGDKCCVISQNCVECETNTECKTCVPGFFKNSCNETCHGGCDGSCHILTGECTPLKEAHQQNVVSRSGLVATAAVLGTLLIFSLAVNVVLFALFLLKKIKVSRRKHNQSETELTYENQLQSVGEKFQRTTTDATDTHHSETVERNVYEGIRNVNEKEHEYQQVSYGRGNIL